jgi:hypothetical protein
LDSFAWSFGFHKQQRLLQVRAEFPDIGFEGGAICNHFENLTGLHATAGCQHLQSGPGAFQSANIEQFGFHGFSLSHWMEQQILTLANPSADRRRL